MRRGLVWMIVGMASLGTFIGGNVAGRMLGSTSTGWTLYALVMYFVFMTIGSAQLLLLVLPQRLGAGDHIHEAAWTERLGWSMTSLVLGFLAAVVHLVVISSSFAAVSSLLEYL